MSNKTSNVSIGSDGKLMIEDARILYRNFSGTGTDYNREGDRNFNVIIEDQETALAMQKDGWNVKFRPARDESELPIYHIKVNVNYRSARAPKIYLHAGDSMQMLDETTVGELDNSEILACDMLISPYHYERNGNKGISGYLDTLHVRIKEDPFAHKYANLNG